MLLSCNMGTLTSWNHLGYSRPVTGLFFMFQNAVCEILFHRISRFCAPKERITAIIPRVIPKRRSQKSTTVNLTFIIFHIFTMPTIKSVGNNFKNVNYSFWVIPRRLSSNCRRFGTHYRFHLHRPAYEDGTDSEFRNVGN